MLPESRAGSRARALLRAHAGRPALLAQALADRAHLADAAALERWIARQDWLEVSGPRWSGWIVDASLGGYCFRLERPLTGRPNALRVVAGHWRHPDWRASWWVEVWGLADA